MTDETNAPSIERVEEISSAMRSAGGPHYDGPILISSSECRDILAALRNYRRLRAAAPLQVNIAEDMNRFLIVELPSAASPDERKEVARRIASALVQP